MKKSVNYHANTFILYTLSYPNNEVRYSLMSYLLENYLTDKRQERGSVYDALQVNDFVALERRFVRFEKETLQSGLQRLPKRQVDTCFTE